ncbi:sugar phosphate nucleotidyltransferase [Vallitalea sp.]|jgi:UDP-N-acetylglucosamine diphosphorylase/glucosamine-1-phosphate N-acetyltransferase|uniref:sugar phosphate nucleotidyltransferase n=1 Tax=Vallitalea sp. TaxID=1882829 RepID=UPI0025F9FA66|nr:sugar phosphate nucleotidyltransferase [Vallitalea sp.]MCT4688802.1 sugar phosphate nucleotidyltransferase [Vallitalea sp.]
MKAIVLGAGKGTRLQSEKYNMPKVLRKAHGKPLIEYVIDALSFIEQEDTTIVVGYKKEMVYEEIKGNYKFVSQDEQLGTGHAVLVTEDTFKDYDGPILVAYGDMPLYKKSTYKKMFEIHEKENATCTVLTAVIDDPPAYGRIVRDENGQMEGVVEAKDCTKEQLAIKELNVGVYIFDSKFLFENLKLLKNDNIQNEYYLTDIPKMVMEKGEKLVTHTIYNTNEVYGVNTVEELEFCEKVLQEEAN